MGKCIYCGKQAGFLRKKHKSCEIKFNEFKQKISLLLSNLENINSVVSEFRNIAESSYISREILKKVILDEIKNLIDRVLEDNILSEEEESKILELIKGLNFNIDEIKQTSCYLKLIKGKILRDILNGIIPQIDEIDRDIPFNFQKDEKLIWLFKKTKYYERKIYKEYVGGYQGFSIRIAKGLYYRIGGFKGKPVETTKLVFVDEGLLGVTNKHLYFLGRLKSFRIKFEKIISFEPFSDGIGIYKEDDSSKLQIFQVDDGWFIYNLVSNLCKIT